MRTDRYPRKHRNDRGNPAPVLLAIACSLPSVGGAQPDTSRELEEVIVTAQKREQNIQAVGIAITSFSGKQIARMGITDSTSLAFLVPGVHLGGSSAGQTLQFTIRGVAQNDFSDHTEAPVAVYVDDSYLVVAQSQLFTMFDLERVEVLKGPQGTLFGRNATGGLVHFVTRKPTDASDGYVAADYGSYDSTKVEAAFGGRLTDAFSARVAGIYSQHDAFLDNDYDPNNPVSFFPSASLQAVGGGEDLGREEVRAVRAHLQFKLADDASLLLSANWARSEKSTPWYQSEATAPVVDAQFRLRNEIRQPAGSTAQAFSFETGAPILSGLLGPFPRPVPGGDITGYLDPDGKDLGHTSSDFAFDDLNRDEVRGVAARFDWSPGGIELTAITDYREYEKKLALDIDAAPMNQTTAQHIYDNWSFSEELRAAGNGERYRWLLGAYYLRADYDYMAGFRVLDNGQFLLPPGTLPADYPFKIDQTTENYSLFGQVEFDLSSTLTLITGVRGMLEDKDFDYQLQIRALPSNPRADWDGPLFGIFSDVVGLPVPTATQQDSSDPLWTGKIQLNYTPVEDVLLYAGVNRGVKAGGFNAPADFGASQLDPNFHYQYDEEVLYSYEAGFKTTIFAGTARFNGSVFYYDYQDYQAFFFSGIGGTITNNDAEVAGAELELIASPLAGLDLMLGASYTDATVEDVRIAEGIYEDREPAFTPPFKFMALVRYAFPLLGGEGAVQGDASYTDETYYSLKNFDSHLMEDYWLANARVSWVTADRKWEIAAYVNNLTDEAYAINGFGVSLFCGCSELGVGKPRWWGMEVRRDF